MGLVSSHHPPRLQNLLLPNLSMGNKNGTPVLREQDIAALSKSSGMDAAQVKEHFAAFLESHPNGKMKPKEFREMVEKTMPKSDASKMEKHVFRIYDSNNDGYIDFVEFMLIFHIMSDGTPEEVLEKIFRVFDVNSDGTINKKEMQSLIKDIYGLPFPGEDQQDARPEGHRHLRRRGLKRDKLFF